MNDHEMHEIHEKEENEKKKLFFSCDSCASWLTLSCLERPGNE